MTRLVTRRRNALWSIVAAAGLLLDLSACGGDTKLAVPDQQQSTPTPRPQFQTSVPGTASPVNTTPTIGEVTWTTAIAPATQGPVDGVTNYVVDAPSIIAVMPAANLPPDAEVEARWSYNSTSLDDFATSLAGDLGPGDRWINVRLDRAPEVPWPAGVYQVTVSLDGALVQEASIEVIDPE